LTSLWEVGFRPQIKHNIVRIPFIRMYVCDHEIIYEQGSPIGLSRW